MQFYCYRHIRTDIGRPFYIGIGHKQHRNPTSYRTEYKRAFRKDNRNSSWHEIAKNGYEVEILFESDDKNEIKNKEKEFISLYGRVICGNGELVNVTAGGQGKYGYKRSTPDPFKGKKRSEEFRKKCSEAHIGQIAWNKGKKMDEKWVKRVRERKGNSSPFKGKKGSETPWYGVKHPPRSHEWKEKQKLSHLGNTSRKGTGAPPEVTAQRRQLTKWLFEEKKKQKRILLQLKNKQNVYFHENWILVCQSF